MNRIATFHEQVERASRTRGAAVMAVLNVTPDSFSDGGLFADPAAALARCAQLAADGADILDVGGESTRPGAAAVPPSEQLRRVLPVVRAAAAYLPVSVDTSDAMVAAACLEAGAVAVNDVRCAQNPELLAVAAKFGAVYIVSHMRGDQARMTGFSEFADDAYGPDVTAAVLADLRAAADRARAAGIANHALVFDPGLGFTKNARHSRELLAATARLARDCEGPLLVGASRKSFLAASVPSGGNVAQSRLGASLAAALFAVRAGAQLVRVHDVLETRQALELEYALRAAAGAAC